MEARKLTGKTKQFTSLPLEPDERAVEYPFVLKHLPKKAGVKILDVGASHTPFLLLLQTMSYEAYGLDLVPYNVSGPSWIPINFFQTDLYKIALPDNSFDVVVCISTLEHLNTNHERTKDKQALERFYKWLKPKGMLLLTVPTGTPCTIRGRVQIYDLNMLIRMLEEVGFKIDTIQNNIGFDTEWAEKPFDTTINPSVTDMILQNSCIKAVKP